MKKLLALFLAVAGLAAVPLTRADAHQSSGSTVTVPVSGTTAVLPAAVHLDATVIIEHRRHYYHHRHYYHRHYYHHRRFYYRHGVRHYYY